MFLYWLSSNLFQWPTILHVLKFHEPLLNWITARASITDNMPPKSPTKGGEATPTATAHAKRSTRKTKGQVGHNDVIRRRFQLKKNQTGKYVTARFPPDQRATAPRKGGAGGGGGRPGGGGGHQCEAAFRAPIPVAPLGHSTAQTVHYDLPDAAKPTGANC